MIMSEATSVALRPTLSPKCPKNAAPSGRAMKAMEKVAKAASVCTEGSSGREEDRPDHQGGGRGVDVEIVELDRRADEARDEDARGGHGLGRRCLGRHRFGSHDRAGRMLAHGRGHNPSVTGRIALVRGRPAPSPLRDGSGVGVPAPVEERARPPPRPPHAKTKSPGRTPTPALTPPGVRHKELTFVTTNGARFHRPRSGRRRRGLRACSGPGGVAMTDRLPGFNTLAIHAGAAPDATTGAARHADLPDRLVRVRRRGARRLAVRAPGLRQHLLAHHQPHQRGAGGARRRARRRHGRRGGGLGPRRRVPGDARPDAARRRVRRLDPPLRRLDQPVQPFLQELRLERDLGGCRRSGRVRGRDHAQHQGDLL